MKKLFDDTTTRFKVLYEKNKRFQPLVAFLAGFTWDSFTLTRIDLFLDNVILFSYLLLAGILIFFINMIEHQVIKSALILKYRDWYPNLIQFMFGGLFSGYVVYYFQSASFGKNWLFLTLLFFLFISNEFIKDRLNNLKLQFVFYYIALFSFFIFYLPVLLKTINAFVFILSGLVSSAIIVGILYLLYKKIPQLKDPLKNLVIILGVIFLIINLFYFTNIIPPVPLSLKDAGIYHDIERQNNKYILRFEKAAWYNPFKNSEDTFQYAPGDTVFCFASVFAPTDLDTKIYHNWQFYNEFAGEWQRSDRMNYKISGGRDGGYRGYTFKRNVAAGLWRVDVETEREQLLGRISFEIILVNNRVSLDQIFR